MVPAQPASVPLAGCAFRVETGLNSCSLRAPRGLTNDVPRRHAADIHQPDREISLTVSVHVTRKVVVRRQPELTCRASEGELADEGE